MLCSHLSPVGTASSQSFLQEKNFYIKNSALFETSQLCFGCLFKTQLYVLAISKLASFLRNFDVTFVHVVS